MSHKKNKKEQIQIALSWENKFKKLTNQMINDLAENYCLVIMGRGEIKEKTWYN
jgi:hypothetical protein